MPAATTDSFLEGQGIPVDLPNIETELAKLWGPAAEQVGGPDLENPHVTRIVLANLVVESLDGDAESLGPVLETVIARFPCRAIVVRGSDDPNRRITAEVSALCHLPAPGLPQVCSERIVLHAGPNAVDLVPGAVRPLLEADLPLVLWWTGDPQEARGALPRPGRRVLAAGPRPARPRRRSRRAPPGARPGPLRVQPRQRLVRAGSVARAGRPVLRPTLPPRQVEPDRFGACRGPVVRSGPAAPAGDLAGGVAGRSARLAATRPIPEKGRRCRGCHCGRVSSARAGKWPSRS